MYQEQKRWEQSRPRPLRLARISPQRSSVHCKKARAINRTFDTIEPPPEDRTAVLRKAEELRRLERRKKETLEKLMETINVATAETAVSTLSPQNVTVASTVRRLKSVLEKYGQMSPLRPKPPAKRAETLHC